MSSSGSSQFRPALARSVLELPVSKCERDRNDDYSVVQQVLETRFTQLVGCTVPNQQAGMGAVSQAELTADVSDAGGL